MAVAAAVHPAFLQLAADDAAYHVGVCLPYGVQAADLHAEQAVNAVEVGLGAYQFGNGFVGFLFAVKQQGFFVNDVQQVELREGLHIADQHGQAFFRLFQAVVGVV